MKRLLSTVLLVALGSASLLLPDPVEGREREKLTSRASQNFRASIRRSNERAEQRQVRPITRIILNNTVYRYEGNPTIRHDEASSPEVMFHMDRRQVRAGHAWDRAAR